MKILYYANIHLKGNDGPSAHVLTICRELGRRGHQVRLFTYPFHKSLRESSFRVILTIEWLGHSLSWMLRRLSGHLSMLVWKPDVIYQRDRMEDIFPLRLSEKWHTPLVIEVNGWYPGDAERKMGQAGYEMAVNTLRPRYRHAAAMISTNAGVSDLIINTFDIPQNKVFYIKNSVDIERFRPPATYRWISTPKIILGYVCGYHPDLDVGILLNALSLLVKQYPVELHLVTYSPYIEKWMTEAEKLNIAPCVKFIRNVPQAEIQKALWNMEICLAIYTKSRIRSYSGIEGTLKLWEYWASQRPVIATDLPGTSSYHHHLEQRYLAVEPENPQALAEAIEKLILTPELAEKLAMNGYNYVQQGHSWVDTAREIEHVLEGVRKR